MMEALLFLLVPSHFLLEAFTGGVFWLCSLQVLPTELIVAENIVPETLLPSPRVLTNLAGLLCVRISY